MCMGCVHHMASDDEADSMGGRAKRQEEDKMPGVLDCNVWATESTSFIGNPPNSEWVA